MEAWWEPALRDTFADRRVIIAGAVPAAWGEYIEHLWTAGAADVMIVATEGAGIGDGPDVPTIVAEPPAGLSMMGRIRWGNELLGNPTPDIVDAIEAFDADGTAIAVGSFLNEASTIAGRPFLAHRRPEWVALEDKTIIDGFWDRACIGRLSSLVVTLDEAPRAATAIDAGAGTVWAADARDGFHGGAHHTRWVADEATRAAAIEGFRPVCDRVRVMPFVDGIPCSVHGIVLPDGVAVMRPVEMVTLRRGHDLVYAGCATFWDPPMGVRNDMREIARRAAGRLVDEVGFRGTFTVDGVVSDDGFWPTELNPRFGAGINVIARATGNIPILLMNDLAVAGLPVGAAADEVEAALVDHADRHRAGGTWRATSADTLTAEGRGANYDGSAWEWTDEDPADATVNAGTGFSRCGFEPGRTPAGPSVGARAAALWALADRDLATGLGDLTPAPDPFA